MAAPEFVPVRPGTPKVYESPPRRPDSWKALRPGEVVEGGQPTGARFGYQGPDQGYAIKLANSLRGSLNLTKGEHVDDAISGCLGVAMRRASIYRRAPMMGDVKHALNLFGFLGNDPDAELVAFRKPLFTEVANPHHYIEAGHVASLVPEATLRLSPDAVAATSDWRSLFDLA